MKIKTWKKPLILIAIIIVAASVWAMFTFGNAAAYFNNDRPIYVNVTSNVVNNTNVNLEKFKMYETFESSYDTYYLKASGNKMFVASSPLSDISETWPHAIANCDDTNYRFNHFTASHVRYESRFVDMSDNVEKTPFSVDSSSWNRLDGATNLHHAYNVYYACFSDKVSSVVDSTCANLGTVSPEYDYFYMYSPAYKDGDPFPEGTYPKFTILPKYLLSSYDIEASSIDPSDGSCTITMTNPDYVTEGLNDSKVSFVATPKRGTTFVRWEYSPSGTSSSVSEGLSGQLTPGQKVTLDQEQLMTLTAVFTGTVAPDPVVTPPTAIDGLKYTGSAQTLINAGTTSGGTMMYALGTDNSTAPASGWATELPTGVNVGNYYIWYKVQGNESTNDLPPTFGCVANIAEQEAPIVVPDVTPVSQDEDWDVPSFSSKLPSAYSAPKTEDYLMFSFTLLGLLFAASMFTVASLKLRKKRK